FLLFVLMHLSSIFPLFPYTTLFRSSFGDLTDLAMESLNRIGRVDQLSDGFIVSEISSQTIPVTPPGVDDHRILFTPFILKFVHPAPGKLPCVCPADRRYSVHNHLSVLT